MSQNLREAFQFSKGQQRAIFLFAVLIVILVFVRFYNQTPSADTYAYDIAAQRIDSFLQSEVLEEGKSKTSNYSTGQKQILLRPFDPNVTSYSTLLSLGFKKHQAKTLLNYLDAGGSFTYKEDLLKLYSIDDDDFQKWEAYILLPERPDDIQEREVQWETEEEPFQRVTVELNSANQVHLMEVRGIGPVLSKSILKYRELLGGYHDVNQLLEVYGIDSAVFSQVKASFLVNSDSIRRLDINSQDFYKLRKHPYISQKQAFEITNHIKYKGKFKSMDELNNLESIKASDYERIYPYFVVQ
jgi:competence protein ComEA